MPYRQPSAAKLGRLARHVRQSLNGPSSAGRLSFLTHDHRRGTCYAKSLILARQTEWLYIPHITGPQSSRVESLCRYAQHNTIIIHKTAGHAHTDCEELGCITDPDNGAFLERIWSNEACGPGSEECTDFILAKNACAGSKFSQKYCY